MGTESTCPKCGAAATDYPDNWKCGTFVLGGEIVDSDGCKLNQIEQLCQRYATPAVNVGCHDLAKKVLRIIEGEE